MSTTINSAWSQKTYKEFLKNTDKVFGQEGYALNFDTLMKMKPATVLRAVANLNHERKVRVFEYYLAGRVADQRRDGVPLEAIVEQRILDQIYAMPLVVRFGILKAHIQNLK